MTDHLPGAIQVRHYPGQCYLTTEAGDQAIAVVMIGRPDGQANARRLAACWNALRMFSTEQIEGNAVDLCMLASQRAELLHALQQVHTWIGKLKDWQGADDPPLDLIRTTLGRVQT